MRTMYVKLSRENHVAALVEFFNRYYGSGNESIVEIDFNFVDKDLPEDEPFEIELKFEKDRK